VNITLRGFIINLLRGYKKYVFLFLFIAILGGIDTAVGPYFLKIIIDTVNFAGDNSDTFLRAIMLPAILYVLVTQFHNLCTRLYDYTALKLYPQLRTDITTKIFDYLTEHSNTYFQQHFSGNLSQKISDVASGVEVIIETFVVMIVLRLAVIFVSASALLSVHYSFTLIILIWTAAYVANGMRLAKSVQNHSKEFSRANSRLSGFLVDSVTNIVSTKIFSNKDYETSIVEKEVNRLGEKDRNLRWNILKVHNQQNWIYTVLIGSLIASLIYCRINNLITIGDFAFVLSLSIAVSGMINALTQAIPGLAKEIGKCQQALEVIFVPHEIKDAPGAKSIEMKFGSIKFKDVNFGYSKDIKLFENLSIDIPTGQKIGLVGFSGGGKSTFVNLIMRLYDVDQGSILLDNQNIKAVTRNSIRKQIAMIPQQPDLFHRSVMDNIRYGDLVASNDDVVAAAKKAKCHDFIVELPDGYNSMVGERGLKLSGGQKQRIAIARAILKKSKILILDEATSALDSVTEKEIHDTLLTVMKDKTTLVIAHRLSTLIEMDRIIFFSDGKIVEDGTIEQLKNIKGGFFSKLWQMQSEGIIPDINSKKSN